LACEFHSIIATTGVLNGFEQKSNKGTFGFLKELLG
jgi:hypothetical protein